MKRRHRGVLYGDLAMIVVVIALYAVTEYRLGGPPDAEEFRQEAGDHLLFIAMLCAPFGLGLVALFISMPNWLARTILSLAGLFCILVMAVVALLLPLGVLAYLPMAFVHWHAALTLDSPKGGSRAPSLPS